MRHRPQAAIIGSYAGAFYAAEKFETSYITGHLQRTILRKTCERRPRLDFLLEKRRVLHYTNFSITAPELVVFV